MQEFIMQSIRLPISKIVIGYAGSHFVNDLWDSGELVELYLLKNDIQQSVTRSIGNSI
jgi:hypothetical protein